MSSARIEKDFLQRDLSLPALRIYLKDYLEGTRHPKKYQFLCELLLNPAQASTYASVWLERIQLFLLNQNAKKMRRVILEGLIDWETARKSQFFSRERNYKFKHNLLAYSQNLPVLLKSVYCQYQYTDQHTIDFGVNEDNVSLFFSAAFITVMQAIRIVEADDAIHLHLSKSIHQSLLHEHFRKSLIERIRQEQIHFSNVSIDCAEYYAFLGKPEAAWKDLFVSLQIKRIHITNLEMDSKTFPALLNAIVASDLTDLHFSNCRIDKLTSAESTQLLELLKKKNIYASCADSSKARVLLNAREIEPGAKYKI